MLTHTPSVHNLTQVPMAGEKAIFDIIQKIEEFQREGSGWICIKMQAYLNISFFKPLKDKSLAEKDYVEEGHCKRSK